MPVSFTQPCLQQKAQEKILTLHQEAEIYRLLKQSNANTWRDILAHILVKLALNLSPNAAAKTYRVASVSTPKQ